MGRLLYTVNITWSAHTGNLKWRSTKYWSHLDYFNYIYTTFAQSTSGGMAVGSLVWDKHPPLHKEQDNKTGLNTFPPISGRMCILPVWLAFTEDTMRQVPHKITCRRLQRFTGNCSFPFRTLYVPESWIRSELSMLWGFPAKQRKRWARFPHSTPTANTSNAQNISQCKIVVYLYRKWMDWSQNLPC